MLGSFSLWMMMEKKNCCDNRVDCRENTKLFLFIDNIGTCDFGVRDYSVAAPVPQIEVCSHVHAILFFNQSVGWLVVLSSFRRIQVFFVSVPKFLQ